MLKRRAAPADNGAGSEEDTAIDGNGGNLIRTLRLMFGMTRKEFAYEVSVTVSTVNRWEKAHSEANRLARKAIDELARYRGLGHLAAGATQPD